MTDAKLNWLPISFVSRDRLGSLARTRHQPESKSDSVCTFGPELSHLANLATQRHVLNPGDLA